MAYSATLTNAGAALYALAQASNTPIQLSTMAVGDGGGAPVATPDPTRATLVNQVYSTAISALTVDNSTPNLLWAEMVIAPTVGGWTVREVGVFTSTGVLFAIANFPDTIKPMLATGSTQDLVINFGIAVSNTGLLAVSVDPTIVIATHSWVLATVTPATLFPGGTTYQVLQKNSAEPGDVSWQDPGSPWEYALTTTGGVTTITPLEAYNHFVKVTGALASNATIEFPAAFGKWTVINLTTGPYSLTAAVTGGAGVPILQGHADSIHSDGVSMHYSTASALTRPPNDGSLALANTAYVDRAVSDIGAYETDTGVANAYVIAAIPATAAYANGMTFRFRVAHANTEAATLDVGAGPVPLVRDDGAALQPDDLPLDTLATVTFDAPTASFILGSVVYSQFGTGARLNASDQFGGISVMQWHAGNPNGFVAGNAATGTLPPSTCWDTANRVVWFCVTTGSTATAVWYSPELQTGGIVVNTSGLLPPGFYYVDTSAGPVTVTVLAALAGVYTFVDAENAWGTNHFTINGNGNDIGNLPTNIAATFLADVSDYAFTIEAAATYWRLV